MRRAALQDEEILLAWKNDITTRENSGDSRMVTPEEHHDWFVKRLESKNVLLYIFEEGGVPAGQGRLDVFGHTAEISYGLGPDYRGKGLGRQILQSLEEKLFLDENLQEVKILYAQVKKDNTASRKLFVESGFRECKDPEKTGELVLYKKVVK